jgi:hypothetical protein
MDGIDKYDGCLRLKEQQDKGNTLFFFAKIQRLLRD